MFMINWMRGMETECVIINNLRTSNMKIKIKNKLYIALIIAMQTCFSNANTSISLAPETIQELELRYNAWKADCDAAEYSSDMGDRLSTNYWAIVNMGAKILPFLSETDTCDTNFFLRGWAWLYIARIDGDPLENPWSDDLVEVWAKGGQKLGNERSELIVAKIKDARKTGDKEAEQKHWLTLECLGLFALETLFKELKAGDEAALKPIKTIFTDEINAEKIKQDANSSDMIAWWEKNKDEYKLPSGEKIISQKAGTTPATTSKSEK